MAANGKGRCATCIAVTEWLQLGEEPTAAFKTTLQPAYAVATSSMVPIAVNAGLAASCHLHALPDELVST